MQYREKGTGRFIDGDQQGPGRTLTLEDLEPGTVYEVQVRAKNDEGTGDWSESGEGMTVTPLTVVMASDLPPPVEGPFTVRFSFSEPVTGFGGSDIETGQDPNAGTIRTIRSSATRGSGPCRPPMTGSTPPR